MSNNGNNNYHISLLASEPKDVALVRVMIVIIIKIIMMNSCSLKILLSMV